jgi:hypothetical protein
MTYMHEGKQYIVVALTHRATPFAGVNGRDDAKASLVALVLP